MVDARRRWYSALIVFVVFIASLGAGRFAPVARAQPQNPDPRYPGGTQGGLTAEQQRQAVAEGERLRKLQEQGRLLEAGRDPGMVALSDCNHYVRNASGAPWLIEQMAQQCEAKRPQMEESHPQLKGEVQKCWGPLDSAITFLREANEKYKEARGAVDPMRGQLVKEGNDKQKQAKEEIKKCDTCSTNLVKLAAELGATILKEVMAALDQLRQGRLPGSANGGTNTIPGGTSKTGGNTPNNPGGTSGGTTGGNKPGGKPGGSPSGSPNPEPCMLVDDDTRAQLFQLGVKLDDFWKKNMAATERTGETLYLHASNDWKWISRTSLSAAEHLAGYAIDSGALERDLNRGLLDAKSTLGTYLDEPERLDPLQGYIRMKEELDRFEALLKRDPGKAAGDVIYKFAPVPGCAKVRQVEDVARDMQALQKAERITDNLMDSGRQAQSFDNGFGKLRHTGEYGTGGAKIGPSIHNPECGGYNCFAVAVAKSRTISTGRIYHARAIRPGVGVDKPIEGWEMRSILSRTYALRGVTDPSLYSPSELIYRLMGSPVAMDKKRIEDIIIANGKKIGEKSQGLVFVKQYAAEPKYPGEIIGHVFNVHYEDGVAKFVDEMAEGGPADATFWFYGALEVQFFEVL